MVTKIYDVTEKIFIDHARSENVKVPGDGNA